MKIIILFLALTVLIISSCTKDKESIPSPIVQQQIQSFPNNIGDKWMYRLATNNLDTFKVEIVEQGILPNGDSAKIWKYTYQFTFQTYIDTVYVSYINNDVRIYDNPCLICTNPMPFERLHYILPLSISNIWFTNAAYGDTTKILSQGNITVPAGSFTNVFHLSKIRNYAFNSWTNDTIDFKAHVGLIKLYQEEFSLGAVFGNGLWELASYNVQ